MYYIEEELSNTCAAKATYGSFFSAVKQPEQKDYASFQWARKKMEKN